MDSINKVELKGKVIGFKLYPESDGIQISCINYRHPQIEDLPVYYCLIGLKDDFVYELVHKLKVGNIIHIKGELYCSSPEGPFAIVIHELIELNDE